MIRLHILPPSPRAIKVVALNNYLGLKCELRVIDYLNAEQTSANFAKLNPNKRQPVLEEDGWTLWESNAILVYLASKKPEAKLFPGDRRNQAEVMRWLFWEGTQWNLVLDILITERVKKRFFNVSQSGRHSAGGTATPQSPDSQRLAEGEQGLRELAEILDTHLKEREWLIGDQLTIADFALGAWVPSAARVGLPLTDFKAIDSWYGRVSGLRGWQESIVASPSET